ncbi:carboxypeptidase-like regulatory domain-containing protein [Ichthyenterobacterium magnum]|uniref:Carboxypeptidase-like protein n=1 Tax=Ichthyenterobacterium magnum TaxID=1230530 RepID=A0A420DVP4_9FLAO|nr:carboxypeptidase-like regulatory domain-containing protein [Ichthyenterobacterium magnum]RKE98298.1 carboxypeptidase-like protein [Ichthyenterobacterium magnum]
MKRIRFYILVLFSFSSCIVNAQTDVNGKVIASDEVEGIHIINKTANRFTITNERGEFVIPAKHSDTILVSGIKYQPKEIIVTHLQIQAKSITVYLTENINELDEVVVGKILTGDLLSDIENSDTKRDINFYDLGILGYTGKPKTQTERRLYEADHGKAISLFDGAPLKINFQKILNKISGRTKMLKNRVHFENQEKCMRSVISEFSELLFEADSLEEELRIDFFYFVSDDELFLGLCEASDDLKMLEFLQ